MISLVERTGRDHAWKQAVTNDFLRGDSIATIANRCACHKLRVEQVLREAITGLVALKANPNRAELEPNRDLGRSDTETTSAEPVSTANEALSA